MTFRGLILAVFLMGGPAHADGLSDFAAGPADIFILGEVHDNPAHHASQARLVTLIGPKAAVFEMLSPEQADIANTHDLSDPQLGAALGWEAAGWPGFALYAPVFAALGDAQVFGGATPITDVRQAMSDGPAVVFDGDAGTFGLTAALPAEEQSAREADQLAAHCDALPPDMLPGFVAAQRLRDATLAKAARDALATTGGPVVVITGNGHARRDWGIPAVLRVASPDIRVATLGQFEDNVPPDAPFDLSLAAPPVDRPDPCLAFR